MNTPSEPDEDFIAELRKFPLRPPPPAWRAEILTPAPPVIRWYRSPFWRGMAALWITLFALWLDTRRLTPPAIASGPSPEFSPSAQQDLQALLASLDVRSPRSFSRPLP